MNVETETVDCLCGVENTSSTPVPARDFSGDESFTYRRCSACGLEYLSPRPTRAEIGKYYPDHYYAYDADQSRPEPLRQSLTNLGYWTFYAPPAKRPWLVRLLWLPLVIAIFPFRHRSLLAFRSPPVRRIFEFGAATGRDLLRFRAHGWDVEGCEPSASACDVAARHDIALQNCPAEDAELGSHRFGCVLLNNVFEHVHDPKLVLDRARDALVDDGLLVLIVPNHDAPLARIAKDCWPGYDPPRHLWGFSPRTLRPLLARHGFRVEYVHHKTESPWFGREIVSRALASTRWQRWGPSIAKWLGLLFLPLSAAGAIVRRADYVKIVARKSNGESA